MSLLCPNHILSSFSSDNKIQSFSHGQHGPTWFCSQLPLRSEFSPLHSWITLFQPQWPPCHTLIITPPSISQFIFFLSSQSVILFPRVFSMPGYSLQTRGYKSENLSLVTLLKWHFIKSPIVFPSAFVFLYDYCQLTFHVSVRLFTYSLFSFKESISSIKTLMTLLLFFPRRRWSPGNRRVPGSRWISVE